MIRVKLAKKELIIEGHASDLPGDDIVCSAVSALVQNIAISHNCVGVDYEMRSGYANFPRAVGEYTDFMIDITMLSLSEISKLYPKKLEVINNG